MSSFVSNPDERCASCYTMKLVLFNNDVLKRFFFHFNKTNRISTLHAHHIVLCYTAYVFLMAKRWLSAKTRWLSSPAREPQLPHSCVRGDGFGAVLGPLLPRITVYYPLTRPSVARIYHNLRHSNNRQT